MSNPVLETIALNIQAAVAAITESAGFNQDLECVRPTRLAFEGDAAPKDGRVVLLQLDPTIDEENSLEANPPRTAWLQPFALVAFVINDDTTTTALDIRLNQVRSDIEKKLMADQTRGGNAIATYIAAPERFAADSGETGIIVRADVLYRTEDDDPYTAG